jgi:hypothetical protein
MTKRARDKNRRQFTAGPTRRENHLCGGIAARIVP